MEYYTYAYLREDKTPYYIGKGKGDRIFNRGKTDTRPPKDKSRAIYLKKNLTENEAFRHEIYMISVFGRIDLGSGILRNRTDGGDGTTGCKRNNHPQDVKDKIKKSVNNWFLNNKHKSLGRNIHNDEVRQILRLKKCKYVYSLISPSGEKYTTISPDLFCKFYPEFGLYPSKIRFASVSEKHLYKKWIIERACI